MKTLLLAVALLTHSVLHANCVDGMRKGYVLNAAATINGFPPCGSATPLKMVGTITFGASGSMYRTSTMSTGYLASTNYLSTTAAADLPSTSETSSGWWQISFTLPALGLVNDRLLVLSGGSNFVFALGSALTSTARCIYMDDGAVSRTMNIAGMKNDTAVYTIYFTADNPATKAYMALFRAVNGVSTLVGTTTNTANKINTGAITAMFVGINSNGLLPWQAGIGYLGHGAGYQERTTPVRWYAPTKTNTIFPGVYPWAP